MSIAMLFSKRCLFTWVGLGRWTLGRALLKDAFLLSATVASFYHYTPLQHYLSDTAPLPTSQLYTHSLRQYTTTHIGAIHQNRHSPQYTFLPGHIGTFIPDLNTRTVTMRVLAATMLLAALAVAQKPSETTTEIDLAITSGSSTMYYSLSTNIDNGYASRTVVTVQVSPPATVSTSNVPISRPTDDVPNLSNVMSTMENVNTESMIMSDAMSGSEGSAGGPVTITGLPPAATGCTQFTTISGTPSPLCIYENTTAVTTIFSTQTSDPATEVSPHPASSFPVHSSMSGSSPSMSMPTHAIEPPHSGMMTGSQSMLPPSPSWMEGPIPSSTMWLNSSMTFMTSTRSMPSQMMPSPLSMSHPHSMSHSHSMSMPHGPQSAGVYTMTKNITETLHSTTTIHEPHHSPMPSHHLPKPKTITNVVMTTVVSTVTADEHSKSHCMDHTITKTETITKHVPMPHG